MEEIWKKLRTITGAVTIAQALALVAALVISGAFSPESCVLYYFGAAYAPDISLRSSFFRLFSPILLYSGLFPLLLCLPIQLKTGVFVEISYGKSRFLLIFLVSGCIGSCSAAVFDTYGVISCASCPFFGLLGAKSADFAVNSKLATMEQLIESLFLFTDAFLPFALTSLWPYSTLSGHIFSFVCGFLLGVIVNRSGKWTKAVAGAVLAAEICWLAVNMWGVIDFLDCEFLQYRSRTGEVLYSGNYCEEFCRNY